MVWSLLSGSLVTRIATVFFFSNSRIVYLVSAEGVWNDFLVVLLSTNYNYDKKGLFGVIEITLVKSYEGIHQKITK